MKKAFVFQAAIIMKVSVWMLICACSFALLITAPATKAYAANNTQVPQGASFELMNLRMGPPTDVDKTPEKRANDKPYLSPDIATKDVYFYMPSVQSNDKMYNPVFVYYTDFVSKEDAWNAFVNSGLQQLVEETHGYGIVLTSGGDTYSKNDIEVFKAVLYYILSESTPEPFGKSVFLGAYSYTQRTFVFGEDRAADFINNILTDYPNRLAGVITVNGTVTRTSEGVIPIPAYLVKPGNGATEFYKTINNATEEKTGTNTTILYNKDNDVQQVILSTTEASVLNQDIVQDFWKTLGSKTARVCLYAKVFADRRTEVPFVLCKVPALEEIGVTLTEHPEGILAGAKELQEWYEYVPNAVLADTSKKVPLVLVLHGSGDHPKFEAESQGWVNLAAQENLIVVSLRHQELTPETEADDFKVLLDYIQAKYPIDQSKIYITGFSMGGMASGRMIDKYMALFSGVCFMHSQYGKFGGDVSFDIVEPMKANADKIDLPMYYTTGTKDTTFNAKGIQNTILQFSYLNNMSVAIDDSNLKQLNFYGTGTEGSGTKSLAGMEMGYKQLMNSDSVPLIQLNYLVNADHVHWSGNAVAAWDFLKMFSRNADGSLNYNKDGAPSGTGYDKQENTPATVTPSQPAESTPEPNTTPTNNIVWYIIGAAVLIVIVVLVVVIRKKAVKQMKKK